MRVCSLATLASLLLVAACKDSGTTTPGATVASVTLNQNAATLTPGGSVTLTATARDADGDAITGQTIAWSSSAPTVATVSGGVVSALAVGATTITASNSGKRTTASITVTAAPPASVTIAPNPVDLPLGMQVQLTGVAKDALGNALPGKAITWTSSAGGVATIAPTTGLVSSVAIGATIITATSEGITAQMTLNVRSDPSTRTMATATGGGTTYVPGRGVYVVPLSTVSTCAIATTQRAYCWGQNYIGELGDGTNLDRAVPTPVSLPASLLAITVGQLHACALDTSKHAWCWGNNSAGQFGNGGTQSSPVPVAAGGVHSFNDIAAGNNFVCGITTAAATYCWGSSDHGSLGNGVVGLNSPATVNSTPIRITGDPGLVLLSAGSYSACGLTALGAAWCWGSYELFASPGSTVFPKLVTGGPAFAKISVGVNHRCALSMDRHLYCWGENYAGQLGDGTTTTRLTPTLIAAATTWRSVSAGNTGTCAIATDGRTFCWGQNALATGVSGLVPSQVTGAPAYAVVSAGVSQTCGITLEGSGYCAGRRGGLGNGEFFYAAAPVQVLSASNAVDIARGYPAGCYVSTAKLVQCWAETPDATSARLPSFGSLAVKAVTMRALFEEGSGGCAIRDADSRVVCWGSNNFGELGNGTTTTAATPTLIASTRSFVSVASALFSACGTTTAKELFCWGGRPGVGSAFLTPVQMQAGINFTSVWGTGGDICAISDVGKAYCGTLPNVPTLVAGSQQWMAMTTGNDFKCGLTSTNDAWCMGSNALGQLGDGTATDRTVMTAVAGGLKFSQLVGGNASACGLTLAGAAYCWGDGQNGALGAAPGVSSLVPRAVPGGLVFTKLASSWSGTCGVTSAATVYCWGDRTSSGLGNGETDSRPTPVPMTGGTRFLLYEPGSAGFRAQ